jgi:predicted nucleic acid-binding protein
MLVLDASVVVDLVLRGPGVARIEERLFREGETLHAPEMLDLEVTQALRRFVLRGAITAARARIALDVLEVLPVSRYRHGILIDRVWELRANVSAYDASYIALAEGLNATVVTRDAKLATAPGVRAKMEVV